MKHIASQSLPPFQGGASYGAYLGLKPQAESLSPFGTIAGDLVGQNIFTASYIPGGTRIAEEPQIDTDEERTCTILNYAPLYLRSSAIEFLVARSSTV